MHFSRALLFVVLALLGGLSSINARVWGDPRGFFENEQVTTVEMGPGVTLFSASGSKNELPQETHVLAVDLPLARLALVSVMGARSVQPAQGRYFPRSTPSQMLEDHSLLAVLNASFFEISATQSPSGLVIAGHKLIRDPHNAQAAVLMLADGRILLGAPRWEGHVRVRGRNIPLAHINHPSFKPGTLALYRPPWRQPPDHKTPFLKDQPVRTLILRQSSGAETQGADGASVIKTTLAAIVEPGAAAPALAEDELALVMNADAAEPWRDLPIGEPVDIQWTLTELPDSVSSAEVRDAIAAGPLLVRGGQPVPGKDSPRHPRSALGASSDGHRVLLVVVDGRTQQSAGMSINMLADYLAHLGADEAFNLDGGGSSALVIRRDGKAAVLNRPSDHGRERFVPTAIGVRTQDGGKP